MYLQYMALVQALVYNTVGQLYYKHIQQYNVGQGKDHQHRDSPRGWAPHRPPLRLRRPGQPLLQQQVLRPARGLHRHRLHRLTTHLHHPPRQPLQGVSPQVSQTLPGYCPPCLRVCRGCRHCHPDYPGRHRQKRTGPAGSFKPTAGHPLQPGSGRLGHLLGPQTAGPGSADLLHHLRLCPRSTDRRPSSHQVIHSSHFNFIPLYPPIRIHMAFISNHSHITIAPHSTIHCLSQYYTDRYQRALPSFGEGPERRAQGRRRVVGGGVVRCIYWCYGDWVDNINMEKGRTLAIITFVLVILLTGLHYAFAVEWRDAVGNNKSTRQWFAFIVAATTIELLLAIVLLVNTIKPCFNRKIHAFLIALLLMLEFAIAVVVATLTSQLSILRDALSDRGFSTDQYDTAWRVGVADSVISFVLKLPLLLVALWTALDNLGHFGIEGHPIVQSGLSPVHAGSPGFQAPPASADRLK